MFIDWIEFTLEIPHMTPDRLGFVESHIERYDPKTGQQIYMVKRGESLEGSYESSIVVKSDDYNEETGFFEHMYVSGNINKFINGHNLYGSADLNKLVVFFLSYLAKSGSCSFGIEPAFAIKSCTSSIKRLDITQHYHCGDNERDVEAWIVACEKYARKARANRGRLKGSSLYFGSGRRFSLKFYSKYLEAINNKKFQPLILANIIPSTVLEQFRNHLRYEIMLRTTQIKDLTKNTFQDIELSKLIEYANYQLETLHLPDKIMLTTAQIDCLPRSVRDAYLKIQLGMPLECQGHSRSSFYRIRKKLEDLGLPTTCTPEHGEKRSVTLANIITAKPVDCPEVIKPYLKVA